MAKSLKKAIAVLLSALMVAVSMPFTVMAADSYEVTGYVDVDPIIYTHGKYNNDPDHEYSYMIAGNADGGIISDGNTPGEYSTAVTVKGGKTVESIWINDENNNNVGDYWCNINSNGKLEGVMPGGYGWVGVDADNYCTVRFNFTDGTFEYHKLAVKTNPVAAHGIVYSARTYNGTSAKERSIGFEILGYESNGQTINSVNYSYTPTSNAGCETGVSNYKAMYAPMNYDYRASTSKGTKSAWIFSMTNKNNLLSAESYAWKTTGSAVAAARTGNMDNTYLTTSKAKYYIDLSSNKNKGVTLDENGNYTIKLLVGNIYDEYTSGGTPKSYVSSSVQLTSNNQGESMNEFVPDSLKAYNAFGANANVVDYVQLSGKAIAGTTLNADYKISYNHSSGDASATATATMPIEIVTVDKSALRSVYDEYVAEQLDSRCYGEEWDDYSLALQNAETYLGNFSRNTADEAGLKTALENAHAALDECHLMEGFVKENIVAPTISKDGSYDKVVYCSVCGKELSRTPQTDPKTGDFEGYEDILAEIDALDENDYSTETWTALMNAVDKAAVDILAVATQDDIDAIVTELTTKKSELAPAVVMVNVTVSEVVGTAVVKSDSTSVPAGTVFDATTENELNVSKWTVKTKDAASEKIDSVEKTVSRVVTDDTDFVVYLTADSTPAESNVKVTFVTYTDKVAAVEYFADAETMNLNSVVAPKLAFYFFTGWQKEQVGAYEYVCKATYAPIVGAGENVCNITASGDLLVNDNTSDSVRYDEIISLHNATGNAIRIDTQYGTAYIPSKGYMHAPSVSSATVASATIDTVETNIVGAYTEIDETGAKVAAFNGVFFTPDAEEPSAWGVIVTTRNEIATGTFELGADARIFNATSSTHSDLNEYTCAVHSTFGGASKVYARSYVVTSDGVDYGDIVELEL